MSDTAAVPSPFSNATYRNLWAGNLGSGFGTMIQAVGAAWLMMALTSSVDMVALVQAANALPVVILSLIGGAIADSYNRRKVMLMTQSFMMVISALLALFALMGWLSPWVLLGFTFLVGCGNALNNPSWQASVADIVQRDQLPMAVSYNAISFNLARSMGPAVGGLIVSTIGPVGAFAVNALTYLGPLTAIGTWKAPQRERTLPPETILPAVMAGLRYVGMSQDLLRIILRSGLFGFGTVILQALMPVVAAQQIGGGPLVFGLLLGSFGVGAVGGAFLGPRIQGRFLSEKIVATVSLIFSAMLVLVALSSQLWMAMPAILLAGGVWVMTLSLFNVSVQMAAPRWVVGRALALYQTSMFAGFALGSWFWGRLAEDFGLMPTFLLAAGTMLLVAATGLIWPMPPRVSRNLEPLNRFQEPTVDLALSPRSGPIVVQIVYTVPPENTDRFLHLMQDRKRIRMRDGARNWTLARDLSATDHWVERYKAPTWTDYIRQNQRITQADAAIGLNLRELFPEGSPPIVTRYLELHHETHHTMRAIDHDHH
ncbi:MFS transporter [Ketogulonicigenium vulgare]|uniref:Putative ABC transporter, permease protein n=2 Tax=Ketogulonicigenium vulgare TaxID=92945 RepID=F9Y5R7_KETVW|nr:MFS transporter [Ketogulonicigenium vulgare]AEM41992.1 putative ABC transporter, permease protein [Ketogulonicigenium vulgare WSH-001]ALJ82091.1 ABC transporter permease [Ketogulonicigenium vulgare]ANW34715.1 ABC transporter permease [Ketogulonicigenium vulgare]AOZ55760.1 putative ABC transporter, permease protein [Ketogulonicigenium vulgare]